MSTPITPEALDTFQRFEAAAAQAARVDNVMEGPEVEALVVQMQHHFGVGIFDVLGDMLGDADAVELDRLAADPWRAREVLALVLARQAATS